ncbi:DUF4861 domain-containing protein [Bacteroides sp. 214]|uniref:DUF4861 domain-containing protein n=1 Tax=Bacteroides sp. 214 TaxID=2302935 RepID=UPI0013CFF61D|nr:DUF4861 domain-containing protein [Bacteroides sp. 214]NDW13307.1 DUF4861 domain-containing protein [Bacteroides sp. 214]
MKNIISLFILAFLFASCNESKTVTVTVSNTLPIDRVNEMVEVPMNEVVTLLQLASHEQFVVNDAEGKEVAYQVTAGEQLIFPVAVAANGTATYTIQKGTPADVQVIACGKHYPERVDDIAWENDLVAFRAYGPALQYKGEKAYGYDVWNKYNTSEPVVEARYAMELNPETVAQIDSLKKVNPDAAAQLYASVSYHVDHGNGMDCYKVGPTLGGGTAALMVDGNIIYPYCYKNFEILDNGPLRFTVKLEYNPLTVKDNSNVIETRTISLDAGSHMNKVVLSYAGLNEATDVATGLVLHEPDGVAVLKAEAGAGYITYVDPTDNAAAGNGKIFVGAAFPNSVKEAKALYFSKEEREKERGGADGHVLAISEYTPGSEYTYYFGSAWSKAAISEITAWNDYVADFAKKVRNPLSVTIK